MDQGRYVRARKSEVFTLKTLPFDLILEIVGRVASESIVDVFNLRLSRKSFGLVGKHNYVLEKMAIANLDESRISLIAASRNDSHARSFLKQCINAGNPEALFQQGMVKFFTECDHDAGIQDLLKAAELGHDVASYACGILMYCWGSEELKPKDFALLNSVKHKLGYKIILYRLRVVDLFDNVVISQRLPFNWKQNTFTNITNGTSLRSCRRSCPWKAMQLLVEHKEDGLACEMCTCRIECTMIEVIIWWITRNMVE